MLMLIVVGCIIFGIGIGICFQMWIMHVENKRVHERLKDYGKAKTTD